MILTGYYTFELNYNKKFIMNNEQPGQLKFKRNKLYIVIPSLLEKLYTVVLVQIIQKTNAKEIVAIHFPSN